MKCLFPIAGAVLAFASPAMAGDKDIRIRLGLGGQVQPKYIGADDYRLAPLFDFDFARGNAPFRFEAPDEPFGFALISKGGFSAGPAANFQLPRKEEDVGAPVGRIGTTIELGGFVQYEIGKSTRIRADLRKGLGGHDGVIGSIGADQFWRDGDRYVFSVGPRLLFSDERYQRAYFGVSPAASIASGLPAYSPRGGIHGVAAITGLSYQFTPRVGIFGFAQYERLVGDAAKSPIVTGFGSRDQLSGGVGLTYTFAIKR